MDSRALYNSVRMNWLIDPTLPVDDWQVIDYREMPLNKIFEMLKKYGIALDKTSFIALAQEHENPEELAEELSEEKVDGYKEFDAVYLLIFELWRRLMSHKPSLSIFCDELDHQIYIYDAEEGEHTEMLQEALSTLLVILDENTEDDADPKEVFQQVSAGCANDIESFLYDYISEQIDEHNTLYAEELLEGYIDYVSDLKWFLFLQARLNYDSYPEICATMLHELIEEKETDDDLEYNLELLVFLAHDGDEKLFKTLLNKTWKLLKIEEDFQDLLHICYDYFNAIMDSKGKASTQKILDQRESKDSEIQFVQDEPHAKFLQQYLNGR